MKSFYKLMLLFFLSFFLISCDRGRKAFEDDYQMFQGKEHVYRKVDYKTVYNAFTKNKGYKVIVFAFDPDYYECPYCMMLLPIINEIAIESGIKEILYFDVYQMRMNRTLEYVKLVDYISKQVELDTRNDLHEIIVPDLYVVKDGKILSHHIATFKDEEGKYILNLTDEQKDDLKEIYKNMFALLKEE